MSAAGAGALSLGSGSILSGHEVLLCLASLGYRGELDMSICPQREESNSFFSFFELNVKACLKGRSGGDKPAGAWDASDLIQT